MNTKELSHLTNAQLADEFDELVKEISKRLRVKPHESFNDEAFNI